MRILILAISLILASSTRLSAQTHYYQGKSIKVVVGFTTGGFYDRWARLLSRHMPKHIPGSPEMIVQNMPGAGSVVATNYVYSVAKPDGLTIGFPSNGIYLDQLVGRAEVKFDIRKFGWIGSPVKEPMLLYMRSDAPFKTITDVKNAKEPPKCGSTGTVSSDFILARLLEETLPPLKINTVLGYPGGSEIDLAVEKGEVMCRGMTASPFFGREPFLSWQKKNFVRVLLFTGDKRDERIPDVPTIGEIFDKEKVPENSRRVADVILAAESFGRPIFATPGTPADRIKLLRNAFEQALKDPELIAEAKKGRMDIDPTTGESLEKLANRILAQPPEVIARVKKILSN
ncbi:MAG TPA: tripartite tricarboxylate transporter substrate-binding protein [Candidatus Udaeobacter sp.]|jgi:tripartite-type tricarboxylate transporter receptor subunit TctC|nr:tripartite tricarboxylate transporter substrate-binding protein [Candidatus Udaeobacter sp.]